MKRSRNIVRIVLAAIVGVLLAVAGAYVIPEDVPAISSELEHHLLAQDWAMVVAKAGSAEQLAASPVLRAIKGHACLATNANNDSLALFVSLDKEADRQAWLDWTLGLAGRHPGNAVAIYLKGDALARMRDWPAALAALDRALALNKSFFLAQNARGVVFHVIDKPDKARVDFNAVAEAQPDFVDAYLSRGAFNVYRGEKRGADESFGKAFEKCPECLLAVNGKGSVAFGGKHWDEAEEYFARIPADSAAGVLARYNIEAVKLARQGKETRDPDVGSSVTPFDASPRLPSPGQKPPVPPVNLPPPGPQPKPGTGKGPSWPPLNPWPSPTPTPFPPLPEPESGLPPGGGYTAPIGSAPINQGNWNVVTWYGLAYDMPYDQDPRELKQMP